MTHLKLAAWMLVAGLLGFPGPGRAAATPEELAKLDSKELTPMGSERAGNAAATIPAWEGGVSSPPPGFDKKKDYALKDPFVGDKPLFSITAANVDQYAANLSPGQVALFKRYPQMRMDIYQSRRSAAFSQRLNDGARTNAVHARLAPKGAGIVDAVAGIPFPFPKEGVEAVWNHIFRYRGDSVRQEVDTAALTSTGDYVVGHLGYKYLFTYDTKGNRIFYYLQKVRAPALSAGSMLMIHEPLNQAIEDRSAWSYATGLRRVRRVMAIGYDSPAAASDGLMVTDQVDVYNGDPTRYNWEIKGRQELYVPYNNYKLQDSSTDYGKLLTRNHVNPDYLRYELHRVWKVEGTLKAGFSHLYPRRTLYFDEDTWEALIADIYNKQGQLWRVTEGYAVNFYTVPTTWYSGYATYDLPTGRYAIYGIAQNRRERGFDFDAKFVIDEFTPGALQREGMR